MDSAKRKLSSSLIFLCLLTLAGCAGPRRRRRRRRAMWRRAADRRVLVVPLAISTGTVLDIEDKKAVVKELNDDTIVVEYDDGSTETIKILREE